MSNDEHNLFANAYGYVFKIKAEKERHLLVEWRDDLSLFSSKLISRPISTIISKVNMGPYIAIKSHEHYCELFEPIDENKIRLKKDEERFRELMSRFNKEEYDFINKHISWMLAPRA